MSSSIHIDCSKQFGGSLDGLFHIYHIAVSGEGGYKVSVDDSMHLIEALRYISPSIVLDIFNLYLKFLDLLA